MSSLRHAGVIARSWRLALAIAVTGLLYAGLASISAERELPDASKAQSLRGIFQRRASDDSIYAFEVDGMAQTFRCSFCDFHFRNVTKGEKMTLRVFRQRILAIERDNGERWSEETAAPTRRRRLAMWLGLLGVAVSAMAIWRSRRLGSST